MAARTMLVSLLVDLKDRLSSPLARLTGRVSAFASKIGVLGAAMAAISFAAPIAQAGEWDSSLRNIGITAGLSGAALEAMIKDTGKRYEALALEVGQSSRDIAAGANTLVAAGMAPEQIDALLPIIGRVSTAADAAFEDISKTAFALSDNLRVPADQMEAALASLVVAGKAGRFELSNMAQYFPALTAQLANLGVTGQEAVTTLAAGLQIAMKGAADPSEAANNMKNFLGKLSSPEVKRNFERMGVDLSGVMKDAVAKGINPIEAVLQKVTKLTGVSAIDISKAYDTARKSGLSDAAALAKVGEQVRRIGGADKLANLFGDQQALSYLLPFLANVAEYQQIAKDAGSASTTVIGTDFDSRMAGLEKRWQRFSEIGTQLTRRVGDAFASNLGWINEGVSALLNVIAVMDREWPGSIDIILAGVGAFAALVVALGVLAPAIEIIVGGLGLLGAVVGLIFSPFIVIIAAIAGAAAIIIADWQHFAPFFRRLWDGVKQIFRGALQALKSLFNGDFAGFKTGMMRAWEGLKTAASAGWTIVKDVFFALIAKIKAIDWIGLGRKIMEMIFAGLVWVADVGTRFGSWLAAQISAVDWLALGRAVLDSIVAGLTWRTDLESQVGGWIMQQVKATDWAGLGRDIMGSIWAGMKGSTSQDMSFGEGMAAWIKGFDWMDVGRKVLDLINSGMVINPNFGARLGAWMAEQITSFDWRAVGAQIMSAIWEGMKSLAGSISGWFGSLFSGVSITAPSLSLPNGAVPAGPAMRVPGLDAPTSGNDQAAPVATPPVAPGRGSANETTVGGKIVVTAERGARARVVDAGNSRAPLVVDRGLVLGRP